MSLNLLINQIEEQFSRSRSNVYSDNKREKHFLNIYEVFSSIKELNISSSISASENPAYKQILQYIISDLQYLDSSTLNVIPFEIISCLELALKDWIDEDNLILSTHLSNDYNDFYFFPNPNREYFNQINSFLIAKSIAKIEYRLIKISLPKLLSRDYLSTVALYHELGHFIDFEYNFSQRLILKKYPTIPIANLQSQLSHFQEYFADLFAAQYISDASNQYLEDRMISDIGSDTHPKTSDRITAVNKFLNGESLDLLKDFNEVLSSLDKELIIRFEEKNCSSSNFYHFIPEIIENDKQLHFVYKVGWFIWKDKTHASYVGIPERQKYQMLNNLIEKSISSFFLLKGWNNIAK
ncbi:hypothetical protein [Epilithonimonas sp.]|uniref:hypothetical protein n=1 Tax=Epilithonimonas sp. TaxID=2894511 RepID=UPI0028AF91CC|nr:hypothetical protein [Epilithonimonas sp.]